MNKETLICIQDCHPTNNPASAPVINLSYYLKKGDLVKYYFLEGPNLRIDFL